MKYVKIFDSKMIPCGVVDIEGDMSQLVKKYVKVIDNNMRSVGVVKLGNDMTDAEKALFFQAYNENLILVGVGVASELAGGGGDPTAIDLGLPSGTLWRSMNLGASAPEEAGLYFQWGDIQGWRADQVGTGEGKKYFDSYWTDYKFTEDGGETFTKYNTTDGKTTLDASDDAAVAMLGGSWTMPTKAQFEELINSEYTTTTWTRYNDVNGFLITSKSNGNSIFLPAAGEAGNGNINNLGFIGFYWSSSRRSVNDEDGAWRLKLSSSETRLGSVGRWLGYSVRPVQNASV